MATSCPELRCERDADFEEIRNQIGSLAREQTRLKVSLNKQNEIIESMNKSIAVMNRGIQSLQEDRGLLSSELSKIHNEIKSVNLKIGEPPTPADMINGVPAKPGTNITGVLHTVVNALIQHGVVSHASLHDGLDEGEISKVMDQKSLLIRSKQAEAAKDETELELKKVELELTKTKKSNAELAQKERESKRKANLAIVLAIIGGLIALGQAALPHLLSDHSATTVETQAR